MKAIFLSYVLLAASNRSTTYGFGEWSCSGPCIEGVSRTASGELLNRNVPSVAIPLPKNVKLEPTWIGLKTTNGQCHLVRINDRTSVRLVGKRGFDLSPSAQWLFSGKRSRSWSGKLHLCQICDDGHEPNGSKGPLTCQKY